MPQHEHIANRANVFTVIGLILGGAYSVITWVESIELALLTDFFFIIGALYIFLRWDYGPLGTLEKQDSTRRNHLNVMHVLFILLVAIPFTLSCTTSFIVQHTPKWVDEYVDRVATGKVKGDWNLMQFSIVSDQHALEAKSVIGVLSSKTSGSAAPLSPAVNDLLSKGIDTVIKILSTFCILSFVMGAVLLLFERLVREIKPQP